MTRSRSARARFDGADFTRIQQWAMQNIETLFADYTGTDLHNGRAECPVHGGDSPEAFSVANGKGWKCWTGPCGTGDAIELVRLLRYDALPVKDGRLTVLRELAPRAGVVLDAHSPHTAAASVPTVPAPASLLVSRGATTHTRPRANARPSTAERVAAGLASLRADGIMPAASVELLQATHDVMTLGPLGRAFLTARGFRPALAEAFGFRSIETAGAWQHMATVLRDSYLPEECDAAGLRTMPLRVQDARTVPGQWLDAGPVLVLPYHDTHGAVIGWRLRTLTDGAVGWKKGATEPTRYKSLAGVSLPLPFNAPAFGECRGAELHVIEGELNAYTLSGYGLAAIGIDGAGKQWRPEWSTILRDAQPRRVVAWYDDDKAGLNGRVSLAHTLAETLGRDWVRAHGRTVTPTAPDDANSLHTTGRLLPFLQQAAWRD